MLQTPPAQNKQKFRSSVRWQPADFRQAASDAIAQIVSHSLYEKCNENCLLCFSVHSVSSVDECLSLLRECNDMAGYREALREYVSHVVGLLEKNHGRPRIVIDI